MSWGPMRSKGWRSLLDPVVDGGWGIFVVIGSFLIHVFADGVTYSFGVPLVKLKQEFNSPDEESSIVVSLLSGIMLAVGPLASVIVNKLGCRETAILGSVIATLGSVASLYAKSVGHLMVSVGCVMGFGIGLMYCPAVVVVTVYFEKKRALATGIAVSGAGIGTLVVPPIASYVIKHSECWRNVFYVYGALTVSCLLCALTFRPLPSFEAQKREQELIEMQEQQPKIGILNNANIDASKIIGQNCLSISGDENGNFVRKSNRIRSLTKILDLSLLANPVFMVFAISNFLTSIGFNCPLIFLPSHCYKSKFSEAQGSFLLSAFGAMNTLGRIGFGIVADHKLPSKYGKDPKRNRLWMYIISMCLCGIASALLFFCESYASLVVISGLIGFTLSSYVLLTSVILVDLLGLNRLTSAFGILLLFQGVATFIGPPLLGKLADLNKSYHWTFVCCGVCLFISGVMLFVIPFLQAVNSKAPKKANGNVPAAL